MSELPNAKTLIQAIAMADGKLKGHERYLSKQQIIALCRTWLRAKHAPMTPTRNGSSPPKISQIFDR